MIGVELKESGKDVWRRLLDEGYILNLTKDRILRLVPPLVIEKKDIEDFVRALEKALCGGFQAPRLDRVSQKD
jgi:acetylornithine aminotransferase